MPSE
jgi:hypothetical protein